MPELVPLVRYACPAHPAGHKETPKVDYAKPLEANLCTAQLLRPGGGWRVCHRDVDAHGPPWRPHPGVQTCRQCSDIINGRLQAFMADLMRRAASG